MQCLQDLEEEIQYMIAGRSKPSKVPPGHEICAQGDPADCIWLLHEGVCSFRVATCGCESPPMHDMNALHALETSISLHMAPVACCRCSVLPCGQMEQQGCNASRPYNGFTDGVHFKALH